MTEAPPLRWQPLSSDAVAQWAALVNLLADVDGTEEYYGAGDLAEELTEQGLDAARDTWAAWDGDQLVAFGMVRVGLAPDHQGRVRATLEGGVHPDWRGRGIGRTLMDRMERRAGELAAARHPGLASYWRVPGGLEGADVQRLLRHRGYRVVRWFNLMRLPLPRAGNDGALQAWAPPDADGVRLVTPAGHREAVRLAHNAAFRDAWGSGPATAERWEDFWRAGSNRWEQSTVAIAPDGTVLAYALAAEWVPRELYVNLVGTVPAARRRGLASACLAATIARSASGGYDVVALDVDSASPTAATRMYERLGFRVQKSLAQMERDAR